MTQLEHDAWWGWTHFWSRMEQIWYNYLRYEDIVLEKDLKKGDEKFKHLFRQANGNTSTFLSIVREFWEKNYHFVASDFKGLVDLLHRYREDGGNGVLRLLPDTGSFYKDEDIKGGDLTYSLTKDLYDQIKEIVKEDFYKKILLINYDKRKIIEIGFSEYDTAPVYYELYVNECDKVIEI